MHMMTVVLQIWTGLIVLTTLVVRFALVVMKFFNPYEFLIFYKIKNARVIYVKQIRAGHLSGDCHYKRELLRGFTKIRGHEQVSFSVFILNKFFRRNPHLYFSLLLYLLALNIFFSSL